MTPRGRPGLSPLQSAVAATEGISLLPAVATQDWCDLAAEALLSIGHPAIATVLVGQIEPDGRITRSEATGVAGSYLAEVTTVLGRTQSTRSVVAIDRRDANLVRLHTALDQARDLGWSPGVLDQGTTKAGPAEKLLASPISPESILARRWAHIDPTHLVLGAVSLSGPEQSRLLVVELALGASDDDPSERATVLDAVLPALYRRAVLALGASASDSTSWLTTKEQDILRQLLLGKSVREIAQELGRSPHTVHDHVKSLHRKLNANSRGELVSRALGYSALAEAGRAGASEEAPAASSRQSSHN